MKNFITLLLLFFCAIKTQAQFGFFDKKSEILNFKPGKVVVILYEDSAYNASIELAMTRCWKFNAFETCVDTDLQKYKKENVMFLTFSKSKGSKNKARLGTSEDDFNGLLLLNKYKRKATPLEIMAQGFCSNEIDTTDWFPELMRAVQFINNYFAYAENAEKDADIAPSKMMSNYPSDKNLLFDKKLLVEDRILDLKGKKSANELFDGDVAEVERVEIYKSIVNQDNEVLYFMWIKDLKYCNKLVVSAQNSEVMYYEATAPEKCYLNNKDLEALKGIKIRAQKENNR